MSDELAGFPSLERGVDPIIGRPGSNQWLGHQTNRHDGQSTLSPNEGNRVPLRARPLVRPQQIGQPDAINPLGRGFEISLDGGDDGGE